MKKLCFLAMLVLLFMGGCEKDPFNNTNNNTNNNNDTGTKPTAMFQYNVNGLDATFYNYSTNYTSCLWTFGDGSSSTLANPTHKYSQSGTFSVTLQVTNSYGRDSYTQAVTVTKPFNPTSVEITKLVLSEFPAAPSSGSWDFAGKPDIYFTIVDNSNNVLFKSTTIMNINNEALPQTYTVNYILNNLNQRVSIEFWDEDEIDNDESMGGLYFTPADYSSNHRTTERLYNYNAHLDFTLYLRWYDSKGETLCTKAVDVVDGVITSTDRDVLDALGIAE